jgi:hypothetical protein
MTDQESSHGRSAPPGQQHLGVRRTGDLSPSGWQDTLWELRNCHYGFKLYSYFNDNFKK